MFSASDQTELPTTRAPPPIERFFSGKDALRLIFSYWTVPGLNMPLSCVALSMGAFFWDKMIIFSPRALPFFAFCWLLVWWSEGGGFLAPGHAFELDLRQRMPFPSRPLSLLLRSGTLLRRDFRLRFPDALFPIRLFSHGFPFPSKIAPPLSRVLFSSSVKTVAPFFFRFSLGSSPQAGNGKVSSDFSPNSGFKDLPPRWSLFSKSASRLPIEDAILSSFSPPEALSCRIFYFVIGFP